ALVQNGLTANGLNRTTVNGASAAGLPRTVTPLNQFQSKNLTLTRASPAQLNQQRANAQVFRQATADRARLESAAGGAAGRPANIFGTLPGSRVAASPQVYQAGAVGGGHRSF